MNIEFWRQAAAAWTARFDKDKIKSIQEKITEAVGTAESKGKVIDPISVILEAVAEEDDDDGWM